MQNEINEPKCFRAKNLSDLMKISERISDLQFIGNGTTFETLPPKYISLSNIPELKKFEKWDRYFLLGSELTLSEIENLGNKLPILIHEAVKTIANRSVRNIATLAGNIFAETEGVKHTLYAPLLALDAKLEFIKYRDRSDFRTQTKSIPITKLSDFNNKKWIFSKIRIQNKEWSIKFFKRIGPSHFISKDSGVYAFLADVQNEKIEDIRIAFAGKTVFRNLDLENQLIGHKLPLQENLVQEKVKVAKQIFENLCTPEEEFQKELFLNLLRYSLEQLM